MFFLFAILYITLYSAYYRYDFFLSAVQWRKHLSVGRFYNARCTRRVCTELSFDDECVTRFAQLVIFSSFSKSSRVYLHYKYKLLASYYILLYTDVKEQKCVKTDNIANKDILSASCTIRLLWSVACAIYDFMIQLSDLRAVSDIGLHLNWICIYVPRCRQANGKRRMNNITLTREKCQLKVGEKEAHACASGCYLVRAALLHYLFGIMNIALLLPL